MKNLRRLFLIGFIALAGTLTAQDEKDQKIMEDAEKAKTTLLETNPKLDDFFDNSYGYVIFPNVGKGGFIVGGASGNGVVYENGMAIGMANLKKLDVGLQAGGQAIIEVLFFENEVAMNEFKGDDFSFSAEASAVVLKEGAAFNAKYKDGIAVFALPKAGLMVDASIGGQRFDYEPFGDVDNK